MAITIFATRNIPDEGLKLLRRRGIVLDVYKKDGVIPRKELLKRVKNCDILISLLTDVIDEEVFMNAPNLRMIANYAVGYDNIDLEAAKRRGIVVKNSPTQEISESVAEHCAGLILALAHRIPEGDAYMKAEKYKGWSPNLLLGTLLKGKTLGIVGGGAIGSELAARMHHGFGMNIVYHDVQENIYLETTFDAERVSLAKLAKISDVVSVHVPLLPTTKGLFTKKVFSLMKPSALFINTARGPIVDEDALVFALTHKWISGAALDVFSCEPNLGCNIKHRALFKKLPNVITTPHIASATNEARSAMSVTVAKNILSFVTIYDARKRL